MNTTLPPTHVDQVRQATISTFEAICGVAPESHWKMPEGASRQAMVGIISIVSDVMWTIMLGFPEEMATALAIKFAGFDVPFDSPDMGDVVGEIANILAGDVTCRLDVVGLKTEMSLPTIARGTDVDVLLPAGVTSTRMWFTLPEGAFWLDLALGRYHC